MAKYCQRHTFKAKLQLPRIIKANGEWQAVVELNTGGRDTCEQASAG